MIKLLIVDDEAIIRKGIRHYINWSEHDIEVVGEAANGKLGLHCALSLRPDIVVSDIRMPVMDGLSMAQELRRLMPEIKIIMLSGHSDTEYLLSSIKINAFDFVLKSAKPADIVQAVLKAKEEILSQTAEFTEQLNSKELIEKNYSILHQKLMRDLLQGNKNLDELMKQAALLEIDFPGPFFALIYFSVPINTYMNAIHIALYILQDYNPFFSVQHDNELWGIINLKQDLLPEQAFQSLIENLTPIGEVKILISNPVDKIYKIPLIYKPMLNQSKRLCWYENGSFIVFQEKPVNNNLPLKILLKLESEILESFSNFRDHDYNQKILQFYYVAKNYQMPLASLIDSSKRMITTMYRIKNKYEKVYPILEQIDNAKSVDEIFHQLKIIIQSDDCSNPANPLVQHAKNYIMENYTSDLSLGQIASACYVTNSHLSKTFKEVMHIGIVEYIRLLRIEKAKHLLKTSHMQIQEIAVEVGYPDYKRFSACFLQEVGMCPRAYRQTSASEDF